VFTAQKYIEGFKKLPPEEKRIVVDFVISTEEEAFKITNYSEDDLALLDQRYEEVKKGVNVSGPFSEDTIMAHLDTL